MQGYPISFADQEIILLPERALFWKSLQTLFIADLHLGKAGVFHKNGIPLPDTTLHDLNRITNLIHKTGCTRLIVLGDFIHSRESLNQHWLNLITNWRNQHSQVDISLITGNHDHHAGNLPECWNMINIGFQHQLDSITLNHHPDFESVSPMIAGHLHPKIMLKTRTDQLKLPGFMLKNKCLVLPAFGSMIDHSVISTSMYDEFYAISGQHITAIKNHSSQRLQD